MLEYVGFEYGSALVNNFSLIFTFVFMVFVHLFMFLIYAMLVKYHVKNWFQKWIRYILRLFTLTAYIRMIIQAYLFLLISEISELYNAKLDTVSHQFSYLISLIGLKIWIVFELITFRHYLLYTNPINTTGWYREFYNGIKNNKASRIYSSLVNFRKLILTIWVICFESDYINIEFKICFISFVQICFLFYWILIRPLQEVSDNIILFINELVLSTCTILLIYYNTRDRWNETIENAYISIILFVNNGLVAVVVIISWFITWVQKCFKRRRIEAKSVRSKVSKTSDNSNTFNSNISMNHLEDSSLNEISKAENLPRQDVNFERFENDRRHNFLFDKPNQSESKNKNLLKPNSKLDKKEANIDQRSRLSERMDLYLKNRMY